jgi:hypothetical protein
MTDVLAAYRRPGSPNYGRHFVGLPDEVLQKRNVRALLGILGDESLPARVREYAAGALGEIGDRRAVGALIEALGEAGLRRGAATGLGRMKAREAAEALRELAPRVKAAHWALSQVAVPRTVEEAIEDLRTGQLRLIPRKLGSLPGPLRRKVEAGMVQRFAEALASGDDDLRWYVTALMHFEHPDAAALLARTLEDSWRQMGPTVGSRQKAACCGCLHHRTLRALKTNPSPDAVPNLVATVTNRYRRHAAMALKRLRELDGGGLSDGQIAGMLRKSAAIREPIGSEGENLRVLTQLIRFAGDYGGRACGRALGKLRPQLGSGTPAKAIDAATRRIDARLRGASIVPDAR